MSDEPKTIAQLMDWFHDTGCGELELSEVEAKVRALVGTQAEAVEAERERNAAVVSAAMRTARIRNDDHLANGLRDCLTEIGTSTEPPPPEPLPPEPMTVEGFIEWLYIPLPRQRGTSEIRNQLQVFVNSSDQAQARRDAEIVKSKGWNYGSTSARAILGAAGLK